MIALIVQLFRFLFTNVVGTSIVAGLGLLFICCGCSGFFTSPETEPTRITLADLEAKSEPPKERWLDLKEGIMVWPEAKSLVSTRKDKSGNVTKENVKTIFVPLVSKAVFDDWQSKGGEFPFAKLRVWVKMDSDEFEKHFPQTDLARVREAVEKMKTPGDHKGLVSSLSSEDTTVVKGLTDAAGGISAKQVLVLHEGNEPASKGFSICFGVVLMFFGLGLGVPLVLALVRRKKGQAPDAAAAGDATSRRGSLADAAMAGFDEGVRGGVEEGMRRRAEAQRAEPQRAAPPPLPAAPAPAPAAAPVPAHFYYLRNGQRFGPVPLTVLRNLYRSGELQPNDLVWYEGAKDWMPASSSPYLKG